MFAILPPEMRREPILLVVAVLLGLFVFLPLSFVKKWFPKPVRIIFGSIGFVSVAILFLSCLFPAVARVERLYYQGHDQFYWAERLHFKDPAERQKAATALAALLKSSKSNVRVLVIQDLGECQPEERDIALAALLAFVKDEEEHEHLRWKAEDAIGIMFFQHVVGDLDTMEERGQYQKMIVAQGWDAAAAEFARKKEAREKKQ